MKQLLLVNSTAALNGGAPTPQNLTNMAKGSIGFYHLDSDLTWLAAAPTKDFAIVLGRGANSTPLIIPEVDYATLRVMETDAVSGTAYESTITIPTPQEGDTFTIVLVKKGTVPHERNTWTAIETVPLGKSKTAEEMATALGNYFKAMAATGSIDINVTITNATIKITALNTDTNWEVKAGDDLPATAVTVTAPFAPTTGDKKYIANLASECAAGKGFTDVYADGDSIYPGYPEEVEDKRYRVYTLRFAVGRKSAKTRDERVSQLVHIAVPTDATSFDAIETILEGIKSE